MRNPQFTRHRYSALLHYIGRMILIIGLIILSPLVNLIAFGSEIRLAYGFIIPAIAVLSLGYILTKYFKPQPSFIPSPLESYVLVVITWILAIVFGALPFMLTIQLNIHQALFESTSGWTTTGLSIINPDETPLMILLYRSILQYAGGAGFVIMSMSLLEAPVGRHLACAEGREDQLVPNIKRSSRLVIIIYGIYTVIGIMSLKMAGMGWFEAINHSFTAISTGGFSTKSQSIGYWKSPGIETVIIFLMLLGSTNFATAYLIFKARFRTIAKNSELRFLTGCLVLFLIICVGEAACVIPILSDDAIRVHFFDMISAISTTGFTVSETNHPTSVYWAFLTLLMVVGGGTASTAGGIKQFRVYIMLKALIWEFKKRTMPDSVIPEIDILQGEQRQFLNDEAIRRVCLYVLLYLSVLILVSILFCSYGHSFEKSLFEFASALGTVGLSTGITTPDAPALLLWCQIVGMILGRLEFFVVIIGIIKLVQDLRTMLPS